MKTLLIAKRMQWIAALFLSVIFLSCEKENTLSDLNPCDQELKFQFYFVKKLDLLKSYRLSEPVSNNQYMAFYGSGNNIEQPVWVVLNKKENTVKTYDASKLVAHQKMADDQLYFIDSVYYISYLNMRDGTTNRMPVNPDKSSGRIKHFQVFENYVYVLFYKNNSDVINVERIKIDSGIAEPMLSLSKIRDRNVNAYDDNYIRPYKNTQGDLCLLLMTRIQDSQNSYVAFSYNISHGNEEYYRILGVKIFLDNVRRGLSSEFPFVRYTNSNIEYFNYVENKIYVYPEGNHYQFPYVITKNGEIYHLLTKQLVQTFSPPRSFYTIKYFDAKQNRLFLQVNHQYAILDLNTNCFTSKIPDQFQNEIYVIDEFERLAWVKYEGSNTNIQMYDVK